MVPGTRDGKRRLEAVRNILTLRYDPSCKLAAYSPGRFTKIPPLTMDELKPRPLSSDPPVVLEELIKRVFRLALAKCKTVAISMGGGIDSAVLLSLLREEFPKLRLIGLTLSFGDSSVFDETEQAFKIAESFNIELHVIRPPNILHNLQKMVAIVREPRWNAYYYYVAEAASKFKPDIMLSGDGGDEVLAGYSFRYLKYQRLIASAGNNKLDWKDRAWYYLKCHERDWVDDQDKIFGPKIRFDWSDIFKLVRKNFQNSMDPLSQVMLADYNGKLIHDIIPTNRKISKYFKLKSLSPFVDTKVSRFGMQLPLRWKFDPESGEAKIILREILQKRGLLDVVNKSKAAFGPDPLLLWNLHGKKMAAGYLEDAEVVKAGLIDKEWLSVHLNESCTDPRIAHKMLSIFSLEIWHRIFASQSLSG